MIHRVIYFIFISFIFISFYFIYFSSEKMVLCARLIELKLNAAPLGRPAGTQIRRKSKISLSLFPRYIVKCHQIYNVVG